MAEQFAGYNRDFYYKRGWKAYHSYGNTRHSSDPDDIAHFMALYGAAGNFCRTVKRHHLAITVTIFFGYAIGKLASSELDGVFAISDSVNRESEDR